MKKKEETHKLDQSQERSWAVACHLAGFAGLVIPFGNILGPLIIWLIKRPDSSFVDACGKEAVNFQISMTLYYIVAAILIVVVVGIILLPILVLLKIIFVIIAAVRAGDGEVYQYPLRIPFIR